MIELAALPNPFLDTVVQDAWQAPPDVPEIHEDVFRACLAGIDAAARAVPDSLVIFGPAGSGKTHLLTRLQRHLAATAADAPDRVLRCVFVFVRLQTTPTMLWQHVQRRLAGDLMRRDQGVTQLQRLIGHQMSRKDGVSPRARVMALRVLRDADQAALGTHLAEVAQRLALPRDLCVILEHLACDRSVRDAAAWLAGESLPDAALAELGVGPDLCEDREEVARNVVTALCRLAGETLPIVFCFDQVEALQRGLDDRDAFFLFGRMGADLCDADPNVFLITCIQSALLESFRGSIREADRDRMAKREALLEPLTRSQVEDLVVSRLVRVHGLATEVGPRLFPFSADLVQELASESPCVPRRVLTAAARHFDALQHGTTATEVVEPEAFLSRTLAERCPAAARVSDPADTKRILLHGLEPLAALGGVKVVEDATGMADFGLEGDTKVFAEIRNEADARSLGPRLKKLLANTPRADGARTVILRDPRLPISKTAGKTREHLQKLRDRGVALVEPTVEALAALAALAEILADAKSGDLAEDGTGVSGGAVLEWLRSLRGELAVEPVQQLVAAILTAPESQPDSTEQDLADLVGQARAVALDAAARDLGVPASRLLEIARRKTDRFLVLEGPPEVVVDVAGVAGEVEG